MNRKINLIVDDAQKIKELENIHVNQIDSVFSYSCELLLCRAFNIFDNSIAHQALGVLFDKIRPQGQLIIGTINYKQLCTDYINKKIDNAVFFSYIKATNNHIGSDDIIQSMESVPNAMILEVKTDNYINYITITKTKP